MGIEASTLTGMAVKLFFIALIWFVLDIQSNPDSCNRLQKSFCIGDQFHYAAAHGTHSMTLQQLQYYFESSVTENNKIPIVNFDLSAQLLLPSVPDLQLNNSFLTPMMHSVD